MNIKKISLSLAAASVSLLAIDSVSNLSVGTPHNSGVVTNDSSIDFTWTPPSGVSKYYYILDENSTNYHVEDYSYEVYNSTSSSLTVTASSSNSSNKNYYLHIVPVDSSSTPAYDSSVIKVNSAIDLDAGTVSMSPASSAISEATTISLTGSESGNIYFTTDGSTPSTSSTQYSSPLTITVGKTVKALLVDDAGNSGTVASETYTSTAQPTVQTASDDTDIDGRTFATNTNAGATDIKTAIQIGSGNTSEGFTRYKYKKSTDSQYVEVSTTSTNIDISSLSSGTYTYNILGGDAYNYKDESNKKTVTFTVDNTAPTSLTISYNSDSSVTTVNPVNISGDKEISLSATDASELAYKVTTSSADCPSSFSSFTTYEQSGFNLGTESALVDSQEVKVCMAAKDASGNWASTSKTYTIDKTAPTLTMPEDQSFGGELSVMLSSSSETDTIKYSTETASSCNTSGKNYETLQNDYSTAISISGSTTCLYAATKDEVGNESNVSATLFTYSQSQATLNLDLVDGTTFATTDTHGATPYTDINVTGSNLKIYTYEFDSNGTVTTVDYNSSISNLINIPAIEGEHNITVTGYSDNNATNSTQVRTFTVDNTPPSAFSTSDYNTTTFTTQEYSLTLTKPDGADYMMYSEDNSTYTTTSSSSVSLTFDKTTMLYTKTKDNAGNMSAIYSATFTQDLPVQTYTLDAGWTLTTLPSEALSSIGLSGASVWDYNGSAWGNNIDSDSYEDFTDGNSSKGYWVYLENAKEITIQDSDVSTSNQIANAPSGWSLLGTTTAISDLSDANLTWAYDINDDNNWTYSTNSSELNSTINGMGYSEINTIPAFSGYWIYKY